MKPKRSHKQDKLAKLYDAEIQPIWSQRFTRLLLRDLTLPPKANVLDVGCGTGNTTLELIRRMDDQSRIIAIDPSSAMLDVAREKAGSLSGKRIFFRSEGAEPKLSFADEVYDVVLANLTLAEMDEPQVALKELVRVAKPGGRVLASLPLAGTFGEFCDIFREVLIKRDRLDALERLDDWLRERLTATQLALWGQRAGLIDVTVDEERFTLLFKSSREFFFAPLIEYGWLAEWKSIAGKGPDMQDVFWHIKEAIDAYFGSSSFNVSVVAGCLRGRKPTEEEARRIAEEAAQREPTPLPPLEIVDEDGDLAEAARMAAEEFADESTGEIPGRAIDRTSTTNQIEIGTGEIEVIEERDADLPDEEEDPFDPDEKPASRK